MNKKQLQTVLDAVATLEKDYDFSDHLKNYINEDELKACTSVDEIVEYIRGLNDERELTDTDIMYYTKAMDYLKENDPSLTESMGLAYERGYSCDKINSELLASLLASQNNAEDFYSFLNRLEDYIDTLFDK